MTPQILYLGLVVVLDLVQESLHGSGSAVLGSGSASGSSITF